jgi:hypothetical protein
VRQARLVLEIQIEALAWHGMNDQPTPTPVCVQPANTMLVGDFRVDANGTVHGYPRIKRECLQAT